MALAFGPVEKAALLVLGFVLILGIGEGSKIRALAMVGLGLLLGTVGVDLVSGEERFVFDVPPIARRLRHRRSWPWACSASAKCC